MNQMEEYRDIVEQESQFKPRLYTYPSTDESSAVFEIDDVEDAEAIVVLCVCADPKKADRQQHTAYTWVGTSAEADTN